MTKDTTSEGRATEDYSRTKDAAEQSVGPGDKGRESQERQGLKAAERPKRMSIKYSPFNLVRKAPFRKQQNKRVHKQQEKKSGNRWWNIDERQNQKRTVR